jgi:hypothetical protein
VLDVRFVREQLVERAISLLELAHLDPHPRCLAGDALAIIAPRRHPTAAVAIADKVNGLLALREYPCRSLEKKWQVRTDHRFAVSDESSARISTVLTLRMMLLVLAALLLAVGANVNR